MYYLINSNNSFSWSKNRHTGVWPSCRFLLWSSERKSSNAVKNAWRHLVVCRNRMQQHVVTSRVSRLNSGSCLPQRHICIWIMMEKITIINVMFNKCIQIPKFYSSQSPNLISSTSKQRMFWNNNVKRYQNAIWFYSFVVVGAYISILFDKKNNIEHLTEPVDRR